MSHPVNQYPLVPTNNEQGSGANLPIPASAQGLSEKVARTIAPLVSRQLTLNEKKSRIDALREASSAQAAVAADWLRNRGSGERAIEIELYGESRDRRWLFAEGERIVVRTNVTIW